MDAEAGVNGRKRMGCSYVVAADPAIGSRHPHAREGKGKG